MIVLLVMEMGNAAAMEEMQLLVPTFANGNVRALYGGAEVIFNLLWSFTLRYGCRKKYEGAEGNSPQ